MESEDGFFKSNLTNIISIGLLIIGITTAFLLLKVNVETSAERLKMLEIEKLDKEVYEWHLKQDQENSNALKTELRELRMMIDEQNKILVSIRIALRKP